MGTTKGKSKDHEGPRKEVKAQWPTWQEMIASMPIGTTEVKVKLMGQESLRKKKVNTQWANMVGSGS